MRPGRKRNWLFTLALATLGVALALFGVFGWADKANAVQARSLAELDPYWPFYALAAIGCLAAQVLAACAVVNFARLSSAWWGWRWLALAFYAVAVFFAAYSADQGAHVILSSAHRAAFEAREAERGQLNTEITGLESVISTERGKMSAPGSVGPATRAAETVSFLAATEAERQRLPVAQAALDRSPSLPREESQSLWASLGAFAIFLAWAILDPWGYALVERGRLPVEPVADANEAPSRETRPWWRPLAACLSIFALSQTATAALAAETGPANPMQSPDPIELSTFMDKKDLAFALRDRLEPADIATQIGVHKSTIYRWFAARDKELSKRESVGARDLFATQQV